MNNTKKVLIVEHDIAFRNILKGNLSQLGFMVHDEENCDTGLTTALREHPDLITLDVDMPGKSGITLLKNLRSDEWGKGVHVILLAGADEIKFLAESLGNATYEYVTKNEQAIQAIVDTVKRKLLN